jgi:hypothetical protein
MLSNMDRVTRSINGKTAGELLLKIATDVLTT